MTNTDYDSIILQTAQDYFTEIPDEICDLVDGVYEFLEENEEYEYKEDDFVAVYVIADIIQTNAKNHGHLVIGLENYLNDCVDQLICQENEARLADKNTVI